MPKQPKRLATNEVLRRYSAEGGLVGQMPKVPGVLRHIICALIERITLENRELGEALQIAIETLARHEEVLLNEPAQREKRQAEMKSILRQIARGQIHESNHNWVTLALQRQYLEDYLCREAFPVKANSVSSQNSWVVAPRAHIIPALRVHPCPCNYATSFDDYDAGRRLKTVQQAALQILAFLHHTTPPQSKIR